MGRLRKSSSKILDKARSRFASLESIDPNLDFGNGKDMVNFRAVIDAAEDALDDYNTKLADVDALFDVFLDNQEEVAAMHTEMLMGVKAVYGRDSIEYEKAGGTRLSERKRPSRQVS